MSSSTTSQKGRNKREQCLNKAITVMTYSESLFAYLYHFELPTEWAYVMYAHVLYRNSYNFIYNLQRILESFQFYNFLED